MAEKPRKTRKKAAPAKDDNIAVPTKEESLKANMEALIAEYGGEMDSLQDLLADKVYSYMKREGRSFRRYSFKYKDRTEEDITHFFAQIAQKWDEAPIDSQIHFIMTVFPSVRRLLKRANPLILMALLHDPEKADGKVN